MERCAGVHEGFVNRLVAVGERDVLPDNGDFHRLFRVDDAVDHRLPLRQIRLAVDQVQTLANNVVRPLLTQHERNFVNRVGNVLLNNNVLRSDAAEQGDLFSDVVFNVLGRSADNHVRLNRQLAQFLNGMLSRLRLDFSRRPKVRNQSHVNKHDVFRVAFQMELTNRFEEGQALNVADRAAQFN